MEEIEMAKKMEKNAVMEKMAKISCLGLELSNDTSGEGESRVELPTAFVWINGHTGNLDIRLYANGWNDEHPTHQFDVYYLHDEYGKDYSVNKLDEIIAEMERLVEVRYKLENPEVE
jgi:hypothetical protein